MAKHISSYNCFLGKIFLASNEFGLMGLWFENQKNPFDLTQFLNMEDEFIKEAKKWLDIYFKGKEPNFYPKLYIEATAFQKSVFEILKTIPYGKVYTYNDIAKIIAQKRGLKKMSAQAVGNAIGKNPIAIIIPCHRIIGSNGNLTGYMAGLDKKEKLLHLEKSL